MLAMDYIQDLLARGRHSFTTAEARDALGSSLVATRAALRRLKAKRVIADPLRGFHVILLPQYRGLGCLPPDQFIPDLMAHLGEHYYVGLLSAAAFHGAAHQSPMVFQVIVPRARRDLDCGSTHVQFVARRGMEATSVVQRNTETGVLRIASPEATALELVAYPRHCGYLDNVATVLVELSERIDAPSLVKEADRAPIAWVQRLGYLLCRIGAEELAAHLEDSLAERRLFTIALAPWKPVAGATCDSRWKVAVNIDIEPDL